MQHCKIISKLLNSLNHRQSILGIALSNVDCLKYISLKKIISKRASNSSGDKTSQMGWSIYVSALTANIITAATNRTYPTQQGKLLGPILQP
jgi:hypothetical protein